MLNPGPALSRVRGYRCISPERRESESPTTTTCPKNRYEPLVTLRANTLRIHFVNFTLISPLQNPRTLHLQNVKRQQQQQQQQRKKDELRSGISLEPPLHSSRTNKTESNKVKNPYLNNTNKKSFFFKLKHCHQQYCVSSRHRPPIF